MYHHRFNLQVPSLLERGWGKVNPKILIKLLFSILFYFLINNSCSAQCNTPITPPYFEDFQTNNGGWTTGGANSDWTWGLPNKSVITSALSSKCWIVGGLTGNSYNNSELSWVQSPCFDFTNLTFPYISFKVFWETEYKFDGAGLQYSTNSGATWASLGSITDPVNCLNTNWYNYATVKFVTPPSTGGNGWSGSTASPSGCPSSNGSGGWVTAKHCMSSLAGQPKVIFRFLFGSGTICNNFNGFAFDDFRVENAPANVADFSFSCTSSTAVSFTNASASGANLCPTFAWNFGDPTSASNTSTATSPTHTFSGPGTYTVSLTASGPCNAPSSITKDITITALTPSIVTPITCNGNANGSATVTVNPATGTYTYTWNSSPVQNTQTATNLAAGTYTVVVSGSNTCPNSATINLAAPPVVTAPTVTIAQPTCGGSTGIITVTNPTVGYMYSFNNGTSFSLNPISNPLSPGSYQVIIKDLNGCTSAATSAVINVAPTAITPTFTALPTGVCAGATITPLPTISNEGITGTWSPALNNTNNTTYTFSPSSGQCASNTSHSINVNPILSPTINCGISATSSVTFNWAAVVGATGYNISYQINGGTINNIGAIGNVLTYTVTGLNPNDNVTITVTPTGAAGSCFTSSTKTCIAIACNPPTPTINYPSSSFCISNSNAQTPSITPTGGTFSVYPYTGLSINTTNGVIIPNTSTAGNYTITYSIAGSGGCPGASVPTTIQINPLTVPTFNLPTNNTICAGATLTALPSTSIEGVTGTWSPALNNAATTAYTFTPTAGQCAALPPSYTINVNAILAPIITCGTATLSSVTFNWVAVTGATGYNISYQINSSPTISVGAIGNILTYTVTGLSPNDNVTITVTPTGAAASCFNSSSKICTAVACNLPTVSVSYLPNNICNNNSTIQSPILTGTGSFMGGVYSATPNGLIIDANTGNINPVASAVGTYSISYTIAGSGNCPSVSDTKSFTISPKPTITASDVNKCVIGVVNLSATSTNNANIKWYSDAALINLINTGNTYSPTVTTTTTYYLVSNDANSCKSDVFPIKVNISNTPFSVSLGNDVYLCDGDKKVLSPGNFSSYLWQDLSTQPTYTVANTGLYSVKVTNSFGCVGNASVNVFASSICDDIYFPSAFSPNGDSKNDFFCALGDNVASVTDYTLSVYNRWGQLVFVTYNPFEKWDGKLKGKDATMNSFVWYATYKFKNRALSLKKGTVMLLK